MNLMNGWGSPGPHYRRVPIEQYFSEEIASLSCQVMDS